MCWNCVCVCFFFSKRIMFEKIMRFTFVECFVFINNLCWSCARCIRLFRSIKNFSSVNSYMYKKDERLLVIVYAHFFCIFSVKYKEIQNSLVRYCPFLSFPFALSVSPRFDLCIIHFQHFFMIKFFTVWITNIFSSSLLSPLKKNVFFYFSSKIEI